MNKITNVWQCMSARHKLHVDTRAPKAAHWTYRFRRALWCALVVLSMPAAMAAPALSLTSAGPRYGTIGLLLPDAMAATDPLVMAWLDAAEEEGVRVETLTDTQFLQLGSATNLYAGMIFPDQLHTSASDALVMAVQDYVTRGGKAMLVYDFGVLTSAGAYAIPRSRLSNLAGVDYALYDELRDRTTGLGPLIGAVSNLRKLQVPPGKSMLFDVAGTTAAPGGFAGRSTTMSIGVTLSPLPGMMS